MNPHLSECECWEPTLRDCGEIDPVGNGLGTIGDLKRSPLIEQEVAHAGQRAGRLGKYTGGGN